MRREVVALEAHARRRLNGICVLTTLVGDPDEARVTWGTWAAAHGHLTLLANGDGFVATVEELLAQMPWTRTLLAAQRRLAHATGLTVQAIDAALDGRHGAERRQWIEDIAAGDPHVRVAGWLLTGMREGTFAAAPLRGVELLAVACDLAAPIGVLVHHREPSLDWGRNALKSAAALAETVRGHAIGVTFTPVLAEALLAESGAAHSLARQGLITVDTESSEIDSRARSQAEQRLYDALRVDHRTRDHFKLNHRVSIDGRDLEVDLLSDAAKIAVEIDGWHHFRDLDAYRRDRTKDVVLQRAGHLVMRFLAEDTYDRLELTVDEIAVALVARLAEAR